MLKIHKARSALQRLRSKLTRAGASGAIAASVLVEDHVILNGCQFIGSVRLGYRSYANNSVFRNVDIGRFCSIGRRCSIGAALHATDAITTHPIGAPPGFESDASTIVGSDVWIGDNVVIMAGITVGHGAVIGAGAIVTKDVGPYEIVAGVPARLLRRRFDQLLANRLLNSEWWRYGDWVLQSTAGTPVEQVLCELRSAAPAVLPPHFAAR